MNIEDRLRIAVDHWKKGELHAAITAFQEVLDAHPDHLFALANLANAYRDQGSIDLALKCYRKALKNHTNPDVDLEWIWSNYLMTLNYSDALSPMDVQTAHADWGKRFRDVSAPFFKHSKNAGRRLHIGFVSPDLRWHSVAFFFLALLKHLDSDQLEVTCFSDNQKDDDMTAVLKNFSNAWVHCSDFSDQQLLKTIRRSRVDVLVDLAGHTAYNRMNVFGHRAAPVQVSWLGYPTPTGNAQIDYWMTDEGIHPDSHAELAGGVIPVHLPCGAHAYLAPMDAVDMPNDRLPSETGDADSVWLGCFNHRAKLSEETLKMWVSIMQSALHSKLLLKTRSFADERVVQDIRSYFGKSGIDPARLVFMGRTESTREHLQCYRRIDLALDTYPYNGTTTTCESLWMGVPVVSRIGETHASRVSGSLLKQLGKAHWVSDSAAGYVASALSLIADPTGRKQFRKDARSLMHAAGLTDGQRFAKDWTDSVRRMWECSCLE